MPRELKRQLQSLMPRPIANLLSQMRKMKQKLPQLKLPVSSAMAPRSTRRVSLAESAEVPVYSHPKSLLLLPLPSVQKSVSTATRVSKTCSRTSLKRRQKSKLM